MLANNKKSNLERHFSSKHNTFASKYLASEERKRTVREFQYQNQKSSSMIDNWAHAVNTVNLASFLAFLEIAIKGKPFTDGERLLYESIRRALL